MSETVSGSVVPPDWKALEEFSAGIDGNRMPRSDKLAGTTLVVVEEGRSPIRIDFRTVDQAAWERDDGTAGTGWYEAIDVRPDLHYVCLTDDARPYSVAILVVHRATGRTLTITSAIAGEPVAGEPRVGQTFTPGVIDGVPVTGVPAAPSRDLIGLRALYRYSPHHLYEHVYLSSERYAWQCLVGEQRGHGDVDLATTWRLGENLYVFTFREFLIPVAATWLYDFDAMRTTGTFVGLDGDGSAMVAPGGAHITFLGRVSYPDEQPV